MTAPKPGRRKPAPAAILLIGAGRMGGALLKGWLAQGLSPIIVVEPAPGAALKALARKKAITLAPSPAALGGRRIRACVVALKPQILKAQAPALAAIAQSGALMISIAAGTRVATLAAAWGKTARIVRAMPNTPGAIGRGITGLYAARGAKAADKKSAAALLAGLGQTVWVRKEALIDSVTAVSGSGPAYVFLLAEALTAAGIGEGLAPGIAEKLARATLAGAGALLAADKASAAALRQAVTSPGGTTAAALDVLMAENGLAALMRRAVGAARKRAAALG